MKDFVMIENMEKKAISGSHRRAQLLFACLLLCLGGGHAGVGRLQLRIE